MEDYFHGQVALGLDGEQQQHVTTGVGPLAALPTGTASPSDADTPMMGMDMAAFDGQVFDQNAESQNDASRRHSFSHSQQTYSPSQLQQARLSMSSAALRALGGGAGMPLLDFSAAGVGGIGTSLGEVNSGVEDAFRNFSFGTDANAAFPFSPVTSQDIGSNAPIGHGTVPSSQPGVSGFSAQSGILASAGPVSDPFSSLQPGIMAYPGLDMSQIAAAQPGPLGAGSLAYFPNAGPDASAVSGVAPADTLGEGLGSQFSGSPVDSLPASAFVPAMDANMNMDNNAALLSGDAANTLHMLMSGGQQPQQQQYSIDMFAASPQTSQQTTSAASTPRPLAGSLGAQQQALFQNGFSPPVSTQPPANNVSAPSAASVPPTSASMLPTAFPTATEVPPTLEPTHGLQVSTTTPISATIPAPIPAPVSLPTTSPALVPTSKAPPAVAGPQPPPAAPINTKTIKNYYSSSGFDMIRALYYVSSRPNPEISIGPVDLSCAFVVCDATLDDYPIIYISDNFQHLTGYSNHEILGQNCRFLQAPDGRVKAGTRREFTDNEAVQNIKDRLIAGREVQQSLINYRKGGKPFLNLLTMIPIPWDDSPGVRYFIGLQIDLVDSPDAVSGRSNNSFQIDYKHRIPIPQYVWDAPKAGQWSTNQSRTLAVDDVSTLLQISAKGLLGGMGMYGDVVSTASDLYRQSWDKMLLENMDDVVHVLSLKGVFLYVSPSCKTVLEYEAAELLGKSLSSVCHPSDIVPVTREMRDTQAGQAIDFVFRVRRKRSGYTWFESHGSLLVEQGKGRKCIVLVGRKRPAFALRRRDVDINGGIGDSEIWTKLSTSGMLLHASSNVRSLLDLQPDSLVGTSMQDLMRKESRAGFSRALEKVRRGIIASCRHEVQHRRGQVLQASTILYPGDADRGHKPTFVLGQTRLLKSSASRNSHSSVPSGAWSTSDADEVGRAGALGQLADPDNQTSGFLSSAGGGAVPLGSQDAALAADDNIFDELKTTRGSNWQFELRQMEKANRLLAEELGQLLANRKKRKRRKGVGNVPRDCANCHTRNTPEWRRGPSGQRDLCNSCGLRWAKQVGRVSPRNSTRGGGSTTIAGAASPKHVSPPQGSSKTAGKPVNIGKLAGPSPEGVGRAAQKQNSDSPSSSDQSGSSKQPQAQRHAPMAPPPPPSTGTAVPAIREERESGV